MRVLVVSQYFWPENFRINDLVADLSRRGHTVTVLTGLPNYPGGRVFDEFRRRPSAYTTYRGAEVVRIPLLARGEGAARLVLNYLSFAVLASLLVPWRLRGRRFDIVFVFAPSPSIVGLPALVARRLFGGKIFYWLQDLWPETLTAVGAVRPGPLLDLVGRLSRYIYRQSDLLLTPTRGLGRYLAAEFGRGTRIEYLPNWADAADCQPEAATGPERPSGEKGMFEILYAGNIGDAQDLPAILDAADALRSKPVRWLIAGTGRRADWLAAEVIRRGLGDNVRLLGLQPREAMPELFAEADALVLSLQREPVFAMSMPSRLQSYLSAGRPILGMVDGDTADVIAEARAGLVAPAGDGAGLARNAIALMQMPEAERRAMGERGRAHVRHVFCRDRQVQRIEAWMQELTGADVRARWFWQAAVNRKSGAGQVRTR